MGKEDASGGGWGDKPHWIDRHSRKEGPMSSRKRDISTDISVDERVAALSEFGYLPVAIYMMSIPQADDWGRLDGNPRQFKMKICPGFDASVQEIEAAIAQIAAVELWDNYEIDGKKYIAFPPAAWFKRQSYINNSKRTDDRGSQFPANEAYKEYSRLQSTLIVGEQQETPRNSKKQQETAQNAKEQQVTPRNASSPSPSPSPSVSDSYQRLSCASAKPDDAIESQKSQAAEPDADSLQSRFGQFWQAYPKKRSKGDAQKAWKALKPDAPLLASMLAALEWQRKSPDWRRDGGQFVPFPASYLRARGWEDQPDIEAVAEPPPNIRAFTPPPIPQRKTSPPSPPNSQSRGLAA